MKKLITLLLLLSSISFVPTTKAGMCSKTVIVKECYLWGLICFEKEVDKFYPCYGSEPIGGFIAYPKL